MLVLEKKGYTRSDLLVLVWAHPMTEIAAACGASDVLLRKFFRAWDIPYPTKAQRGKLTAGRHVRPPSLPERPDGDSVVLDNTSGRPSRSWPPTKPRPSRKKNRRKEIDELIEAIRSGKHKSARRPRVEPTPIIIYVYKLGRWSPNITVGPFENTTIVLNCEMVAPRKSRGREAKVELKFVEYLTAGEDRPNSGSCEYSGTTAYLFAPATMAASTIEILCAGRLRYLRVTCRPAVRHRYEDVETFDLVSELEDGDLE